MPEIKPCLYCGGPMELVTARKTLSWVGCFNDGCMAAGPEGDTQEAAIAAWERLQGMQNNKAQP